MENTDSALLRTVSAVRHPYVTHLECGLTAEGHEARVLQTVSRAGKPLLVR
jgi:hypothetical protein